MTHTETELNTLHELSKVSHTATAVNAVRCLAAVGVSLSKQSQPSDIVKVYTSTHYNVMCCDIV